MDADGSGPEIGATGARFGGASRRKARKRAAHPGADPGGEADTDVFAAVPGTLGEAFVPPGSDSRNEADEDRDGPMIGYTGARFGGTARRRRSVARDPVPAPPAAPEPQPTVPPLSLPGLEHLEEHRVDPSSSSFVRPYVITGGRTRPQLELSIEALVSVVPDAPTDHLGGEHLAVVELCRQAHSVAEIGAVLGVPLGVARVLVGDLVAAGTVATHRTADAGGPDMALMERVLAGLRRL